MLDNLSSSTLTTRPREISGRYLARNNQPTEVRARIAADILDQRATVVQPTVRQAADLCRVSTSAVNAASGRARKQPADPLAPALKAFNRATPQQQIAFVRAVGPETIWAALSAAL